MTQIKKFGDGWPMCAVVTDEDTPLTIYCKSLQATYLLDIRQDTRIPLDALLSLGIAQYEEQMQGKKGKSINIKNKIKL